MAENVAKHKLDSVTSTIGFNVGDQFGSLVELVMDNSTSNSQNLAVKFLVIVQMYKCTNCAKDCIRYQSSSHS